MTTTILIALGALAVGALAGALPTWHRMNNALIAARIERRFAQAETARVHAAKDADDREYDDLWAHAEGLAADLTRAWNTIDAQAEVIREWGIVDARVDAHDAEVVEPDPFDVDLPALAAVAAVCPVSPAPVVTWDAPTGSWAFVERPALAAEPAYLGRHRADEMAGAAA